MSTATSSSTSTSTGASASYGSPAQLTPSKSSSPTIFSRFSTSQFHKSNPDNVLEISARWRAAELAERSESNLAINSSRERWNNIFQCLPNFSSASLNISG